MARDRSGVRQRHRSGARSIPLPWEVSYRTMQDLEEMSCVPREDLLKYAKGRRLSGWIVQSPEKFDTPSPLAEFSLDRPPMSWQYVEIPDEMEAEHE